MPTGIGRAGASIGGRLGGPGQALTSVAFGSGGAPIGAEVFGGGGLPIAPSPEGWSR